MLYEVRAYTFTIGSLDEAVEDFGSIIEERTKLSRLICFFRSAIGDLDRIFHIWEYENAAHRERVRAEAQSQAWWPPLKAEKILYQQTRLMTAAPFRASPRTGAMGSVYEVRSDTIHTGTMGKIRAAWDTHLPAREELSPLAAALPRPESLGRGGRGSQSARRLAGLLQPLFEGAQIRDLGSGGILSHALRRVRLNIFG